MYTAVDESQSKSQPDYNKRIIHFFSFMHTDIIKSFVIRVNMHIRVILIKNMNSGILQVVYYPVEGMFSKKNLECRSCRQNLHIVALYTAISYSQIIQEKKKIP